MNINDVFIKCVEKWAENELDDRINFAMDKFDDWIKDFDEEEKDILCKILEKFNYYPLGNINKLIKELSDESRKVFGVSNDDSVISVVRKADGKLNSSHEYCQIHRLVSGLNKKIYYDSLDNINENDWDRKPVCRILKKTEKVHGRKTYNFNCNRNCGRCKGIYR